MCLPVWWGTWLRQSCHCHLVCASWQYGGSGGLISSSLLHSSKCRKLFRCLTSPAGELTQRKVRVGPCQGSAVQRKELYWNHVQKCYLSAIYFCQGCSNAITVSMCSQAPESATFVQASPSLFVSSPPSWSYLFASLFSSYFKQVHNFCSVLFTS